jgi:hypothetical protein
LTRTERKLVTSFMQAPADYFDAGEIFGILRQMKETFESKSGRGIRPPYEASKAGSGLTCTPNTLF